MEAGNGNQKMQLLISATLRIGVIVAVCIAIIGGVYMLSKHGLEPLPNYKTFHGSSEYVTSLGGIFSGLSSFRTESLIQLGVLVLMLTPIARVVLSIFDFAIQRDWLYAVITAVVLAVIIANSIGGF